MNQISTGNILDVAPQQEEHPTKAVNYADGTGVVANRKPSIHTNSDTHLTSKNMNTYRGVAVSPAAPQVLDVADRATGNAPVTDGLQVGNEGVSGGCEQMRALHIEQGQDLTANGGRNQFARSCENTADSRNSTPLYLLASEIVDIVEFSEQLRLEEEAAAEEGAAIEASGYTDPVYEVRR